MTEPHRHATYPYLIERLNPADSHLRPVIGMIEDFDWKKVIADYAK